MSSSIRRSMQGKENDSFEDNVATASYLHRVSYGKDEVREERNDPNVESTINRQAVDGNFKEPPERPQNREQIVKMTMQALNQYLQDVCVYFYKRKKELLNLNELDQWHEMNEKQKSVEKDIADMRRMYEESKHITKPYEEYFRYHMHEIARLHLLSIQIREELLSIGIPNKAEKKKLNDIRRRAEKALRLSAPVESKDVLEKSHIDEERLRRDNLVQFASVSVTKDERSFRNSCMEEGGASSVANSSFGNRRPMGHVTSTILDGATETSENRVTSLRDELKQKREEANVLRENFDRKLHSGGGCGVNLEHREHNFLTSAENSVLEQIKAHEDYIEQTSDHIAYLDQLQFDRTPTGSTSNLHIQNLSSSSLQYGATKSTSVTTTVETSTSALLSDVSEIINTGSRSGDADSMNDVMLSSQSSTLVPESDYASEIEDRETSFEEHPKSKDAIHHQQEDSITFIKSSSGSVHFQETVNEMRMPPEEIPSAAVVAKMNQVERMEDVNFSVDEMSDKNYNISEYNLSQLDETVNTKSVIEGFGKLHIGEENDSEKEESHNECMNSVSVDEAAAFSGRMLELSQISDNQASFNQDFSSSDHSSAFFVKGNDMQSMISNSQLDNDYSPKLESSVPKLNLGEIDTNDLHQQLGSEQEKVESLITDHEEQQRSEHDEKLNSVEISAHLENDTIEQETKHPVTSAPSSNNLPERELSPVDDSETAGQSLVLHVPDKDQVVETNNSYEEIIEEVPLATEQTDTENAVMRSNEVGDESVVESNASKVDDNEGAIRSETSEDADSECFFTDTASSHQVSLASSHDFALMKAEELFNEDDISAGETLIEDAPAELVGSECVDDDSTQKNILSSVNRSEDNLNDVSDVFVDAQEFNSTEGQILDRTPEMLTEDINSSVINNTSQRLSFGRERIKSDDESESLSVKQDKRKRFGLTVSPLNAASPRSPLATRFATVMPSPTRNRSPRSLNGTPRSPRVTSTRVVSPLGKLLLDQSLNDSLMTMLTAMNEKKLSVGKELEKSISFHEQNSTENMLSDDISGSSQERNASSPQSLLEKSWMNDSAKYDLNSIPVPPNLLDVTPLDLSDVYNNDESNKSKDTDSIQRVTEEKQRPAGVPDLTCDTPIPTKTQSRTLAVVEDSNKKFYCDDRDEICLLIRRYADRIWQQFTNGETLYIDAECNKSENEHPASVAYKQMVADECCAVATRAFARDVRNIWINHGAAMPPRNEFELENVLRDNILNVLCPDCSKPKAKTRWESVCRDAAIKSSVESYYLTKAVMDEVYRDEDRWYDFEPTEENIKETLAEEIFTDQIHESFNVITSNSVGTLR